MKRHASSLVQRQKKVDSGANLVRPVVLCGGSGSRLWPLSNEQKPKQLLSVQPPETMLQATVRRCSGPGFRQPIIVTAEDHRLPVADQLRDVAVQPTVTILEPARRNTAAAVALAAYFETRRNPAQLLLVVPADHVIADVDAFRNAVSDAIPAARKGAIVTFGIEPSRPETGFGYIEAGALVAKCGPVRKVARFVEKPDAVAAAAYVEGGKHLWNAGILLARAATLIEEIEVYAPEVSRACESAVRNGSDEAHILRPDRSSFLSSPSQSIDCAVMERTDRACVLPVDMRWSDVGSWDAFWAMSERDGDGNAISGNVVTRETSGCLIRSESGASIAALGVSDLVIVATNEAVLVTARERAQDLKHVVEGIRSPSSKKEHAACVVRAGATTQQFHTSEIVLAPADQISVIARRSCEHWIVIAGTARVTIGKDIRILGENESAFVPALSSATVENIGRTPVYLLAVQRLGSVEMVTARQQQDAAFPAVA